MERGNRGCFHEKEEKYTDVSSVCSQAGWRAFTYPVEVEYRSYTGTSTHFFLKSLGITSTKLKKALKDMAE